MNAETRTAAVRVAMSAPPLSEQQYTEVRALLSLGFEPPGKGVEIATSKHAAHSTGSRMRAHRSVM
jgi:hypothetical protein